MLVANEAFLKIKNVQITCLRKKKDLLIKFLINMIMNINMVLIGNK